MKVILILLFALINTSCNNSKLNELNKRISTLEKNNVTLLDSIQQYQKELEKKKTKDTFWTNKEKYDEGTSYFKVIPHDSVFFGNYFTKETTYSIKHISLDDTNGVFIAKYITETKGSIQSEGTEKNIKIELSHFDKPNNILYNIEKECHQIELENKIYKTYQFGCCLEKDIYEFYDYSNKSIVKSNLKIISSLIPNSNIDFYVGYEIDQKEKNSDFYSGTLTFAYDNSDKYIIKTFGNKKHDWFNSELDIISNSKKDYKIEEDFETVFNIWSLNEIRDKENVNEITLILKINDKIVLKIPIINGKPFGKNDRIHKIKLEI
ncbi:hypothetical protein [Mesoflavibacter profundi]|uniref:hypothetical protein n=1 Tax=Mesoflavibacter profundi TaxID=2708110 RepID=UPI00168BBAFB|nr:hypothetical protein [Mesoflavibacter profundi]